MPGGGQQQVAVDPDRSGVVGVPHEHPVTRNGASDLELSPRDPDFLVQMARCAPGARQVVGARDIGPSPVRVRWDVGCRPGGIVERGEAPPGWLGVEWAVQPGELEAPPC